MSRITFFLSCLCRSQHTFRTPDRDRKPHGDQGAHCRCFLALMVDTSGSTTPAPPRGAPSTFLSVDGGRSRVYSSDTTQGARRRCFLALMVGTLGSTAPTPPRGPPSTFLSIDGRHSRVYSSETTQEARRRCFIVLMVDAPESPAPAPPRRPTVDVS
jgi:hypothetical protein